MPRVQWVATLLGVASISLVALGQAAPSRPQAPARASTSGPASATAQPSDATRATLSVLITGFKSDAGQALVAVYRDARGFPDRADLAVYRKALPIVQRTVRVTIEGLRPGPCAVALVHDVDRDFKLATGLFGIPTEGYGASRDAPARFGPPSFSDAAFELKAGEHKQVRFAVRY